MTTILITPKECSRIKTLSELAVKNAEKYGSIICCNDSDSEIRRAFESCCEYPAVICPVNIVGNIDFDRMAEKCGQGYDMTVILPKDGTRCIAALNRLPRGSVVTEEIYGSAADENFSIAVISPGGYLIEVKDSESYRRLVTDILYGRFIPRIPFDKKIFKPPFPGSENFMGEYPLYIGRNCHFGKNVTLTAGSCIGDNVYIGNDVKIISSVVSEGMYIHDGSVIENTVAEYTAPVSLHVIGTDGSTAATVSLSSAFAAGQSLSRFKTAAAHHVASAAAAQGFIAGMEHSGGNISDMGAIPENVFRYGLNIGDYQCGVYFGDGYVRIWGGDGLPSDEALRRQFENALNGGTVKAALSKKGLCTKLNNIYKLYNSALSKLIVTDVGNIFADVTTPDRSLYRLCRTFSEIHHLHCRDNQRIAFHISGDGSRISAYTDETGYVFHDRLVMLCLYYGNYEKASVYSSFPHIEMKNSKGRTIKFQRFEYAPDYSLFTDSEKSADKKARAAADITLFDSVSIMARLLNILAENKLTLGQAISPLPVYSCANRIISSDKKADVFFKKLGLPASGGKADIDSHKAYLRPLRTGGIILSAESTSLEAASEICDFFEEILKKVE